MDSSLFDALARALSTGHSRRSLPWLLGAVAWSGPPVLLGLTEAAAKKKRKKKSKAKRKKKCSYPGQRRCGDRCIGEGACCTDVECRASGECAGCVNGQCVPDGRICRETYGPCYSCHHTTLTCVPAADDTSCGECRICVAGNCVGCLARGECNGCVNGQCRPDGSICLSAYGPCSACGGPNPPFTCNALGSPCQVGAATHCCREDETCCADGCANLARSREHCGGCETRCLGLQFCEGGACRCPDLMTWCEGARACIFEEQTCCGQHVCSEGQVCCGSGDTARCSSGSC